MQSHLHPVGTTTRQGQVMSDDRIGLHVLDAIEALEKTDGDVGCFGESELF